MKIRLASITDANAIFSFDHIAASDPTRVRFIRDQIASAACYVATIDSSISAYAVLNYVVYGNGCIDMLYVHPQHRRQGLGYALLQHLIGECRTPKLFTSTNRSNLPMQALLDRLGFERRGHIENLDEGDPELVYLKLVRQCSVIRAIFRRAARGQSPTEIARAIDRMGWRTKERVAKRSGGIIGGGRWTARQVVETLRNPVYVGMFADGVSAGQDVIGRS